MAAISTPEPITARGSVLRGSLTSWLIAETSSRPVNVNAICDQKLTVSQLQCGSMFAQVNCVADPWQQHSIAARQVKINSGTYVPTPPAFCSHFPIFSPMMFRYTATPSRTNDPEIGRAHV